jgi:ubiquinone/menaquinone biosynthesis C-methylase UbiE
MVQLAQAVDRCFWRQMVGQGRNPTAAPNTTSTSYDRLSRVYDALFDPFEAPLRAAALGLLAPRSGERILEIGSGTGRALVPLATAVASRGLVAGIDLSARMLAACSRQLGRIPGASRVGIARARAQSLPLQWSAFDAVFMSFTLELFEPPDDTQVLAECRRVLRPSGRMVVLSLWKAERPAFAARAYSVGHRLLPTLLDCRPIELDGLLRRAGFVIHRSATHSLSGIPVRLALATRAASRS